MTSASRYVGIIVRMSNVVKLPNTETNINSSSNADIVDIRSFESKSQL